MLKTENVQNGFANKVTHNSSSYPLLKLCFVNEILHFLVVLNIYETMKSKWNGNISSSLTNQSTKEVLCLRGEVVHVEAAEDVITCLRVI